MTNTQAILTGAVLIAAAAFLASGGTPRAATGEGRYVLAVAGGQPIAYVTDTATGATMVCRTSGCLRLEITEAAAAVAVPVAPAPQPSAGEQILQPPPEDLQAPTPSPAEPSKSPAPANILDLLRGNL